MQHRAIAFIGAALLTLITGSIMVAASPYPVSTNAESPGEKATAAQMDASCTLSFSDVPWGSTFYPYVRCLACSTVLGGYPDGTFRPSNNITRGQLSKIVSNAAGLADTSGSQTFQDVSPDSTFFTYVQALSAEGYINGYPCGGPGEPCLAPGNKPYFRVGSNATRGQISKIVSNANGFNDPPAGQTFEDVPPSHTFYQWVERLASRGVMAGYPCGTPGEPCSAGNKPYFRPQNNATRGQLAKIVSSSFSPECSSAQAVIDDALQSGHIDYRTSLLYRAYALFGDLRLPNQYIGTGSSGEDDSIFYEATVLSNTIPPAILAQLQPFIVRPDNAGSIFHDQTPVPTVQPRYAASNTVKSSPSIDIFCDAAGWAALESTPGHFKVWARCDPAGPFADPETAQMMADLLLLADTVYGPMTQVMGTPVPDMGGPNGGGDSAIDMYLVDPLDGNTHNGREYEITDGAFAFTQSDLPNIGPASSAYIVVPRNKINTILFRNAFIHEFFHVLQMAHTRSFRFGDGGEYWFVEASANWAEAYFDRTITTWPSRWTGRQADFTPFNDFETFQGWGYYRQPLHLPGPAYHLYTAFIWPFFMEQETGGPQAIVNAWNDLEGATTPDQAIDAIGAQLPFPDNFHKFAVRNLNKTFDGQNPLGTRYIALDPLFPDEKPPQPLPGGSETHKPNVDAPSVRVAVVLPSLAAHYETFLPVGTVGHWEFDFTGVHPNDDVDIDAVVLHNDGTWELRSVDRTGMVSLCDVMWVHLVLSNHNPDRNSVISGHYTYRALSTPCGCEQFAEITEWNATATYNYQGQFDNPGIAFDEQLTIDRGGSINALLQTPVTDTYRIFDGDVFGQASINDEILYIYTNHTDRASMTGNGSPINDPYQGSHAQMRLDLQACTYDFRFPTYINAVDEVGNTSLQPSAGIFQDSDLQLPGTGAGLVLSGSGSFPVTPGGYVSGPLFWPAGFAGGVISWPTLPDMGTASVTWNFSPVPTPTPSP
ncbi:MAG: S-layer homology domain-containing protein [Chloroflexota bacterium]